ncbi:MAG: DISARM system phospholipase D-like protein DrmC [Isosphaeraceae bacterium]
MKSFLHLLSIDDLRQLAGALRSGRLSPPISALVVRRYVTDSMVDQITAELQQYLADGIQPRHVGDMLDIVADTLQCRHGVDDAIDLVWTGPEAGGIASRDTAVVVRELFQSARESVLVAGYAVYRGHTVFRSLAEQMDHLPNLQVRMFLDVRRQPGGLESETETVRRFSEHFVNEDWPGTRLPTVYYDPRSLELDHSSRASLHAKCIVVDDETAFVSSANFTEAAQLKNIEVGVIIKSPHFATHLSQHFDALAAEGVLKPVPLG